MISPTVRLGIIEMLLTYARAFAMIAASVEFNRGQINGSMLTGDYNVINANAPLGQATLASLATMRDLCATIPSLGPVTDPIDRVVGKIEAGILPLLLHNELEALQHRMLDELKRHYYYPVTEGYAAIYMNPSPWGEEVYNNFPSARLDIQNAGRSIILGQATAGVFHLMRVLEVGLKVLGREASIPWAPSWESYLSQFQKKFEAKYDTKSVAWKRKEPLMKELSGDLAAIKLAWRNPTMHIVREYSMSEGEQIYNASKTFMERLAIKYREKGKPIAVRVCLAPDAE